ncbi:DUF559 domain-containing protein [Microbacterium sp. NPDC089320]|uniref:endonuclease domain-containing protein n=1 Tax=Microbacterium sp. NPDC089320 TaxID=3155182 RepID=UPI00344524D6
MGDANGIARVERLHDRGVSRYDIDTALVEGVIERVRVGWVALPGADRMLVAAASRGVVLTCGTQARRLGVWVHDEHPGVHLGATPGSRGGKPRGVRVHWSAPTVPRHPDSLEDPIENVLAMIAVCEPYEQALASWESALNLGLVTREVLEGLTWRPAARRLLRDAWPFSDAGLETYLRSRLSWLRIPLYFQVWIAGHRVDALIGARLVIQIDGGTHVGARRNEDNRHDAELKLRGYHVIRIGYHQVIREWHVVQDLIMRAVAQGLHRARKTGAA